MIHLSELIREEIIKRELALELCISCNVHGKMLVMTEGGEEGGEAKVGSYEDHHFQRWWKEGVCPVVLCVCAPSTLLLSQIQQILFLHFILTPTPLLKTDDVGIFCSPLSNEYALVAQHFHLTPMQLCDLASSGINAIFAGEEEKTRLKTMMALWR